MKVVLTRDELVQAAMVGVLRHIQNMYVPGGSAQPYGKPADPWSADILGAAGEMAFAKGMGLFWSGALGAWGVPDVGKVQVRTTEYTNGSMPLHDQDKDDEVFVLARGVPPRFELAGWTLAGDGKANREKEDRGSGRPCFYVPARDLRPMHELLIHLERGGPPLITAAANLPRQATATTSRDNRVASDTGTQPTGLVQQRH